MAAGTTNMADATTLLTTPAASAIGPTARTRPASRAGTVLSAISGTDPPPTPRTAPRPRRAGRHRAPDTIRATGHPGARGVRWRRGAGRAAPGVVGGGGAARAP